MTPQSPGPHEPGDFHCCHGPEEPRRFPGLFCAALPLGETFPQVCAGRKKPLIAEWLCGRNRTPTCDPIDVNDVLYQLSHATKGFTGEDFRGLGSSPVNVEPTVCPTIVTPLHGKTMAVYTPLSGALGTVLTDSFFLNWESNRTVPDDSGSQTASCFKPSAQRTDSTYSLFYILDSIL